MKKEYFKIAFIAIMLFLNYSINAQTFEWAKSFGGWSFDGGTSITVDASGNVYTTGFFQYTVDFDPGAGTTNLTSKGYSDVYVQKLDPLGNLVWAKSFGGTSSDGGNSITVDASGNAYITGYFIDTVDFDPGAGTTNLTSNGSFDVFVQKLNPSGNLLWVKSFGGTSGDRGHITVDVSGNVYTTGEFGDTVDFDPGAGTTNHTSNGFSDAFIQKFDPSGNLVWARSFGGKSDDGGTSITVDALGNVYTTGFFRDTVDFDPGARTTNLTSNWSSNVFVQKLDPSGNLLWVKSFGGTSNDGGMSITADASGNAYLAGFFRDTVDFDPGAGTTKLASKGGSDVFVQKLDASGNLLWVKSFGGWKRNDVGISITLDTSGIVYTTGYFGDTVDFDPGVGTTSLSSKGYSDVFVQKMSQSPPLRIIDKNFGNKLVVYPNPTSGNFSIDLGDVYESSQVIITDISRKKIESITKSQTKVLNLSIKEPDGIYLISIHAGTKTAVIKMVKQ